MLFCSSQSPDRVSPTGWIILWQFKSRNVRKFVHSMGWGIYDSDHAVTHDSVILNRDGSIYFKTNSGKVVDKGLDFTSSDSISAYLKCQYASRTATAKNFKFRSAQGRRGNVIAASWCNRASCRNPSVLKPIHMHCQTSYRCSRLQMIFEKLICRNGLPTYPK